MLDGRVRFALTHARGLHGLWQRLRSERKGCVRFWVRGRSYAESKSGKQGAAMRR